jgi:hypothetical protein
MLPDTLTTTQLAQVISQATAPAFLLGAVAGFVSVLIGRLNRIMDSGVALNQLPDDDPTKSVLKTQIPHLMRRARLIHKSIEFAVVSGIFTTFLVLAAFASAFFEVRHERGAALLFMVALVFFAASLITLWREIRVAIKDLPQYY